MTQHYAICNRAHIIEPEQACSAGVPVVSAASQFATEAIIWAFDGSATLYAWDADTLVLLWNSADIPANVAPCSAVDFAVPTVLDNIVCHCSQSCTIQRDRPSSISFCMAAHVVITVCAAQASMHSFSCLCTCHASQDNYFGHFACALPHKQ